MFIIDEIKILIIFLLYFIEPIFGSMFFFFKVLAIVF